MGTTLDQPTPKIRETRPSTAGGIKVTTFMVLFFAIMAETRGEAHVDAFGREVRSPVLRQALTVEWRPPRWCATAPVNSGPRT